MYSQYRRESIGSTRSHPLPFITRTEKIASPKHHPLSPESFDHPLTRAPPSNPTQNRINKYKK
ncbi:hypothetical protein HID58_003011 [Brassica napus]|uniref:Uncharacterized protein n=1 Tax=Brassica napus TaxID=3708 RepID=A0ABQ8EP82_BRANA|nr:hypothetical protein HID58_003011 [Brassica napus]